MHCAGFHLISLKRANETYVVIKPDLHTCLRWLTRGIKVGEAGFLLRDLQKFCEEMQKDKQEIQKSVK